MPDPQHPAENALQRYAEQRRREAPDTPPVALKTILLKEAQKQYPAPPPRPSQTFWFRFRFLGPAFAMLLAGFFLINHWQEESKRPLVEPNSGNHSIRKEVSLDTLAEKDSTVSEEILKSESAQEIVVLSAPAAPVPVVAPSEVAADHPLTDGYLASKRALMADQVVSTGVAIAGVNAPETESGKSLMVNFVQTISKTEAGGVKEARVNRQPSKILSKFLLRQEGDEILIEDEDGSIYRGRLVENKLASRDAHEAKFRQANDAVRKSDTADLVEFEVSGINRTLNQKVSIEGQIVSFPGSKTAVEKSKVNQMQINAMMQLDDAAPIEIEAYQEVP